MTPQKRQRGSAGPTASRSASWWDLFAEIPDADKPKDCGSCKWHEDFNGVCFNGDSERCAGYTDSDESCDEWEDKS